MKVLAVTNMYPSPARPGWGAFVKAQVDSLVARGVAIDVFVIEGYKSRAEYVRAIWRVRRLCARQHYDLVHAHYGLSGLVACAQRRYPVVVSFCGDDLLGTPGPDGRPTAISLLWAWMGKRLAPSLDGVIVKSEAMRRLLPGIDAVVIPNGVSFERFKPMDMQTCRQELGLKKHGIYLLFPYSPAMIRKNYPVLQAAVARLNAGRVSARVEILVVDDIPQERMPLYLNAADALVLPSMWEGSPNAVKEAMACNTRIVSTDVGDVRDIIDGVDGCVICEATAADFARGIDVVLRTPCKTRGRDVIGRLAEDRIACQIEQVYEGALTRHRHQPAILST